MPYRGQIGRPTAGTGGTRYRAPTPPGIPKDKLGKLIKDASELMSAKGHKPYVLVKKGRTTRTATLGCLNMCDMDCKIQTHPAPNSTEIGGRAVTLNCPKGTKYPFNTKGRPDTL